MKSNNEFEKIDQRSVCNHYALYASGTNPTWLKKKTPRLLEIQNTSINIILLNIEFTSMNNIIKQYWYE
jgi:hypothetical protein